jgi:hypothetical protein
VIQDLKLIIEYDTMDLSRMKSGRSGKVSSPGPGIFTNLPGPTSPNLINNTSPQIKSDQGTFCTTPSRSTCDKVIVGIFSALFELSYALIEKNYDKRRRIQFTDSINDCFNSSRDFYLREACFSDVEKEVPTGDE